MSYPGNNSLAAEIQDRILTTFEQTLDLASRGELREAGIGCDFILRLDPSFQPADRLKERLAQGEGPLLVDDLRLAQEPAPTPTSSGDVFDLASRPRTSAAPAAPKEEPAAPETEDEAAAGIADDTPPPGLMTSPSGSDGTEVFSDVQAQELEAALDWDALSAPAAGDESATDGAPDRATDAAPPAPPADTPPANAVPYESAPPLEENDLDAPGLMSSNEPLAALDSESEQRIQELLGEGQTAFDDGQYQSAIDAWSRIFLVDIDHQEASRRIELARKLKAEVERQVEELYHEGVSKVESGDFDGARENFHQVVEMQGSHLAAQEYLDKLDAGTIKAREVAAELPPAMPTEPLEDEPAETLSVPSELAEPLDELDAVPGDALELPDELGDLSALDELPQTDAERPRRERPPRRPAAAKPRGIKRSFLYIGGAVLLLAAAAGWFLVRNFDDTFPNAGPEAPPTARPQVDVIARAQQVFDEGNSELAIAQLKRLPPNHPRYAEAQALIAQWETPDAAPTDAPIASPEQLLERDLLVAEAKSAFDNRQFLRSHRLLTQAAAVTALGDEGLQLQTAAALELQPLRSEIEIFKQGEWAEALRSLWQIRQDDPSNPDVMQLMVDSYYNLGVRELQRRDPAAAAENLQEALDLAGADPELERVLRFAQSYQNRSVDLLYRIFVKYLPFR